VDDYLGGLMAAFSEFLSAFPRGDLHRAVDAQALARQIESAFEVEAPAELVRWWEEVGSGYFANRELYIFSEEKNGRDSLVEWNSNDFWRVLFPPPVDGGPIFFAENCFGNQLGFRYDGGRAIGYLLDADTFEAYRVSEDLHDLFTQVLTERYAFTNPDLLKAVHVT
jgi:hypothetical protein